MAIAKRKLAAFLFLLTFGAPAAMADLTDSVTYSISFTGSGILPTSAGFTYDPDTPAFSSFLVEWDGVSFDLTSSANAPDTAFTSGPACLGGSTGASASFALLTGACASNAGTIWFGDTEVDHSARFEFTALDSLPTFKPISVSDVLQSGPASHDTGSGFQWAATLVTAAPTAAPEPAGIVLSLTMLLSVALLKRIQRRIRS